MDSKTEEFYNRLKTELGNTSEWPSEYLYKFIIPTDIKKIQELEKAFDNMGAFGTTGTTTFEPGIFDMKYDSHFEYLANQPPGLLLGQLQLLADLAHVSSIRSFEFAEDPIRLGEIGPGMGRIAVIVRIPARNLNRSHHRAERDRLGTHVPPQRLASFRVDARLSHCRPS